MSRGVFGAPRLAVGPSTRSRPTRTGYVYLIVDGMPDSNYWLWLGCTSAIVVTSSATVKQLSQTTFGTLTPGSHTFTLRYWNSLSGSGNSTLFSAINLMVQPI